MRLKFFSADEIVDAYAKEVRQLPQTLDRRLFFSVKPIANGALIDFYAVR